PTAGVPSDVKIVPEKVAKLTGKQYFLVQGKHLNHLDLANAIPVVADKNNNQAVLGTGAWKATTTANLYELDLGTTEVESVKLVVQPTDAAKDIVQPMTLAIGKSGSEKPEPKKVV